MSSIISFGLLIFQLILITSQELSTLKKKQLFLQVIFVIIFWVKYPYEKRLK